jgi:hypothetical protein
MAAISVTINTHAITDFKTTFASNIDSVYPKSMLEIDIENQKQPSIYLFLSNTLSKYQ